MQRNPAANPVAKLLKKKETAVDGIVVSTAVVVVAVGAV